LKFVTQAKIANPQARLVAKGIKAQGVVYFYSYVGTDGALRGIVALRSPSPLVTENVPSAFSAFRLRPAVCDNGSVTRPMGATADIRVFIMLKKVD
jgi:hypothetical protein